MTSFVLIKSQSSLVSDFKVSKGMTEYGRAVSHEYARIEWRERKKKFLQPKILDAFNYLLV